MKKYRLSPLLGLFITIISCFTVATPANAFTLRNYQTGLCLAVAPNYPYPGVPEAYPGRPIIVWTCDGTASQQWAQLFQGYLDSIHGWIYGDIYATIFDTNSNFYLSNGLAALTSNGVSIGSSAVIGVSAGVMKNGTPLISWGETKDTNQQWSSFLLGKFDNHDCYIIFNNASLGSSGQSYVMGVAGGNPNRGAQVMIWKLFVSDGYPDFFEHPDQYWCVYY